MNMINNYHSKIINKIFTPFLYYFYFCPICNAKNELYFTSNCKNGKIIYEYDFYSHNENIIFKLFNQNLKSEAHFQLNFENIIDNNITINDFCINNKYDIFDELYTYNIDDNIDITSTCNKCIYKGDYKIINSNNKIYYKIKEEMISNKKIKFSTINKHYKNNKRSKIIKYLKKFNII